MVGRTNSRMSRKSPLQNISPSLDTTLAFACWLSRLNLYMAQVVRQEEECPLSHCPVLSHRSPVLVVVQGENEKRRIAVSHAC